jgi:transcriptional regulator with XRE-family HTH domain
MTNMSDFILWLNSEMGARGKIQADIAKTEIVTDAAVSNLFSGETKNLTYEMGLVISKATGIQLEDIYVKAGLLPPKPDMQDPFIKDMLSKLSQLTDEEDRALLGEIIVTFIRRTEGRKSKPRGK